MWSCPSGHNWRTIRPHATHYENKTLANVVQPQLKDNSTTHDITMAILLSTIGGQFDHRRQCRGQCFCSVHLSITPQYTSVHLSTPRHSSAPLSTTAQICCSFTCERAQSWQNADVRVEGFEGQSDHNRNSPPDQTTLALALPKYPSMDLKANQPQSDR